MKYKVMVEVEVEVEVHGDDGPKLPGSYQEIASIQDGGSPVNRAGMAATNPFAWHLFGTGRPGGFLATVSLVPAVQLPMDQWPGILERNAIADEAFPGPR